MVNHNIDTHGLFFPQMVGVGAIIKPRQQKQNTKSEKANQNKEYLKSMPKNLPNITKSKLL